MRIARLTCCVMLAASLAIIAGFASAAPISDGSEIGSIGTYTPLGGTGLGDATSLSFDDATVIIGSNDFAGQVGEVAVFANLSLIGPLPGGPWFTTSGGLSFTIDSLTVDLQSATALDFTVTGEWSLVGFDDTPGIVIWTGDALGGLFTASSAGALLPEPAAAWLLGSALAGVGIMRRRRREASSGNDLPSKW